VRLEAAAALVTAKDEKAVAEHVRLEAAAALVTARMRRPSPNTCDWRPPPPS